MPDPMRYISQDVETTPLRRSLHFHFANRVAPNRFLKPAMEERLCTWDPDDQDECGIPNDPMFKLYKEWSKGGIGTILTGSILFEHNQITQRGDPVIPTGSGFTGKRFEAFKNLATSGKLNGSLLLGQLNHPGRQVDQSIQPHPISASEEQQPGFGGMSFAKPIAASWNDIRHVVEGFAHAALFLERAGFDGVELHAAHGYLLAQFLSPASNHRTDKYGGDLAGRARIVIEIAKAIRERTSPSFILGIKLNSVDLQSGFGRDEATQLCEIVEQCGFDFVELSGGSLEHFEHKRESTRKREAFFLELAESIAPLLSRTKIFLTGGSKTAGAMVQALDKVDGIGLGRPLCQEPQLCKEILDGQIKGAIKQLPDEDNYGLTNIIAGTQIRRMGKGEDPLDMSQVYDAESFTHEMNAWMARLSKDARAYGFFDVTLVPCVSV